MQIQVNYAQFNADMQGLQAMFRELPRNVQDYLYSEMFFGAAQPVVKHAKASPRFKDRSGKLRKSFRRRRVDTVEDGRVIKGGGSQAYGGGRRAPHFFIIERGTVPRVQSTTGRRTGSVRPANVLKHAFEANTQECLDAAIREGRKRFKQLADAALRNSKLNRRQVSALARIG